MTRSVGRNYPVTDLSAQGRTSVRPTAVFVLGMARSGTSALTRVLSLCGGTLPAGMVGADANNPLGYWEPRTAIMLNEKIMRRHGSSWYDPTLRLQEEGVFDADENAACLAEIGAFFTSLPAAPLVVIKEPRITALSGVWFEAARQAGLDIAVVIAVRHPQQVIPSCAKYVHTTPELSSALWLKYNLLAERHTRGLPRVFVDYANFLEDWHGEIKRISRALEVDLDNREEDTIDEYLTADLRRNGDSGPVKDFFGADWISTVYKALSAAARDEPWDEDTLDRVFESYRASERDFRTAFEDSHAQSNRWMRRVFKPFIVKPMLELVALAHGRKGPWA